MPLELSCTFQNTKRKKVINCRTFIGCHPFQSVEVIHEHLMTAGKKSSQIPDLYCALKQKKQINMIYFLEESLSLCAMGFQMI